MRDGQYRLLWTGISDSKKMKSVKGDPPFRRGCHLVYTWLLPWCDDEGRMPGEPLKILANVVPNEGFNLKDIEKILSELHRVNLIAWYKVDGEPFIQVFDWLKYQHIRKDRYKSSIYPSYIPPDNQMATTGCQSDNLILSPSPSPSPSPSLSLPDFEKFWNQYPTRNGKKTGKEEAKEYFFNKITPADFGFLMIAIRNYTDSKQAMDGYAKDPIRFLKKNFWRDWIDPPGKEVPKYLHGLKEVYEGIDNGEEKDREKTIPLLDDKTGDGIQRGHKSGLV